MSMRRSNAYPGQRSLAGGFSSMSLGANPGRKASPAGYAGPPITAVSVNKSLLAPLKLDIDPTVQAVRTHEKDQIKGLNNRFASFIDKVRFLEQQNKMLETKWDLLNAQTSGPSNIDPLFQNYIANLQRQLAQIDNDRDRLEVENSTMHRNVEDYKTKYEEEINKRNGAENDFVILKKDVDSGYLSRIDLEDRVAGLADEVNFLKTLYDEELRELQASMKETSVVVQMDNSRALNMSQIIEQTKAQYEDIATRSRQEAENWYKTKFDQMTSQANQYGDELRINKNEVAELTRLIARLQSEIEGVKGQRAQLETQISEAERRGELAVKDAMERIRDLEKALQRAKQDMARQVREYQELMNIKLALDIEISTYRKLLEGEECRIGQSSVVNVQTVPNGPLSPVVRNSRDSAPKQSRGPVVIKKVERSDSSRSTS